MKQRKRGPDQGPDGAPRGRNGELFYRNETGDNKMMAVYITTEPTFRAGTPRLLFEGRYQQSELSLLPFYDVTAEGQRFLMMKETEQTEGVSVPTLPSPTRPPGVTPWISNS